MKRLILILIIGLIAGGAQAKKKESKTAEKTQAEIVQEQELKYYFYEGVRMFDQEQFAEAMALFMHCEQVDPNDAATANYLAKLYAGAGNMERFVFYLKKAYTLEPESYWERYVYMLYKMNDSKQAKQILEGQIKRDPSSSAAASVLQSIYENENNYKGALKMQDIIDKIDGIDNESANNRFYYYASMGKTKKGIQAVENFLKEEPGDYFMQAKLGEIYMKYAGEQKALQHWAKVEEEYPENPILPSLMTTFYLDKKDTARAVDYLHKMLENNILGYDYLLGTVQSYQWLSDEEELLTYQTIAEKFPQDEQPQVALEHAYKQRGKSLETREVCQTILDINPNNKEIWMDLMWLHLQDSTRTFEQNDSITREVLSHLSEEDAIYRLGVYAVRGDLLSGQYMKDTLRRDMLDSAFVCYEAALKIDPENVLILNNYAYFLAISGGDLKKAEKMSQVTIRKEPRNATYLDTYAWILHLQGEDVLAKIYIKQAFDYSENKESSELQEHYRIINNISK